MNTFLLITLDMATTIGDLLEQHSVNICHNSKIKSISKKSWADDYHSIRLLNVYSRTEDDITVAQFDEA